MRKTKVEAGVTKNLTRSYAVKKEQKNWMMGRGWNKECNGDRGREREVEKGGLAAGAL